MAVQVLVAAMLQTDHSLIGKMQIETDALIGNQCDQDSTEAFEQNGKKYVYFNRSDRGVGLNRNITLLHSGDGIITFADADMVFVHGYAEMIEKAFREIPQADAIIFNIETIGGVHSRRQNNKAKRIHFYNALNYGAARISVRGTSIRRENITFHTCFGGGTQYSKGEDTLFIMDMLKHGLKVYVHPACIASVDQSSSTWFNGYTRKYLFDKGVLFSAISKRWSKLLCLQDLVRHPYLYRESHISLLEAYREMSRGAKAFSALQPYNA